MNSRRALISAALGFLQLPPRAPELQLLYRWLDTWIGLGQVVGGVERQGLRFSLSHIAEGEWRAVFMSNPMFEPAGFGWRRRRGTRCSGRRGRRSSGSRPLAPTRPRCKPREWSPAVSLARLRDHPTIPLSRWWRCPMSLGRVLVVDDDPRVMGILRDMLQHFGYEVSSAASAEEAFAAMVDVRGRVVFLDLQLPGISGLEALAYFREHYPTVPVIVVTGNIEHEMAHQARDRGAFEVIGKPFSLTALKDLLERAMNLAPPQ
jgi:CheY-like chemotaxis protein